MLMLPLAPPPTLAAAASKSRRKSKPPFIHQVLSACKPVTPCQSPKGNSTAMTNSYGVKLTGNRRRDRPKKTAPLQSKRMSAQEDASAGIVQDRTGTVQPSLSLDLHYLATLASVLFTHVLARPA